MSLSLSLSLYVNTLHVLPSLSLTLSVAHSVLFQAYGQHTLQLHTHPHAYGAWLEMAAGACDATAIISILIKNPQLTESRWLLFDYVAHLPPADHFQLHQRRLPVIVRIVVCTPVSCESISVYRGRHIKECARLSAVGIVFGCLVTTSEIIEN